MFAPPGVLVLICCPGEQPAIKPRELQSAGLLPPFGWLTDSAAALLIIVVVIPIVPIVAIPTRRTITIVFVCINFWLIL